MHLRVICWFLDVEETIGAGGRTSTLGGKGRVFILFRPPISYRRHCTKRFASSLPREN